MIVSPAAKLYAIKLAENSVIVLSTAEFQSVATVVGLQIPKAWQGSITRSAAVSNTCWTGDVTPAILHPLNSNILLIAVPARQSFHQRSHSQSNLSVLQMFDVRTGSHISRQALARTNATVLTHSPEGIEISTPDIRFLELSWDGKWLMSIDSWPPHIQDVGALDPCQVRCKKSPRSGEVCLKFWLWDESTKAWELASRIDAPHFCDTEGAVSVLCVASRPSEYEFATIGVDGILRFWDLIGGHHDGARVSSHPDSQRHTWRCRNAVNLNGMFGKDDDVLISASMGFSEDGSVLAVCLQALSRPGCCSVHLINAHNRQIHRSHDQLASGRVCAAKFLGRCLIIASTSSIFVWDTVNDVSRSTATFGPKSVSMPTLGDSVLFAVNSTTRTIAVATSDNSSCRLDKPTKKRRFSHYYVEVYDVHSLTCVSRSTLTCRPVTLLSDLNSGNFVIVDVAANLRLLRCADNSLEVLSPPLNYSHGLKAGLDNLFLGDSSKSRDSNQALSLRQHATFDTNKLSTLSRHIATLFNSVTPASFPAIGTIFKGVVNSFPTA
jgi:NET1-associated nuclear protein 1 (U3 small nucleolar RNA-associated protein 17)